tara:strand:+ start:904 stop:1929 length:1026 start_codon:yes stop_codon:yes gene_type:complete
MSDKIEGSESQHMGSGNLGDAQAAILSLMEPEGQTEDSNEVVENESLDEGEALEEAEYEESDEDLDSDDDDAEDLDDDYDEDESEPEQADTFTVKINGENVDVSLDELQNGYSRQADYTKKSQALAEERKQFSHDRDAVLLERQQYSQLLGALQQQLTAFDEPAPDWDRLFDEDPIEGARQERQYRLRTEQRQQKMQAIAIEQQRVNDANAQEQQQQMRGLIQSEAAQLPELIPEWRDEKIANKQREQLREYLIDQGVAEEELGALVRANHIKVLRKAMLFDQGQKRVRKAQKAGQGGKTVRSGSRQQQVKPSQRKTKAAFQRLKQTGSAENAASIIESML